MNTSRLAEAEELKKILQGKAELWDVKRAAAYYKVIRYSYGAGGTSYGARPVDICRGLGHIQTCSRRLKNMVIENLSFEVAIPRYDEAGTLLYIDPPYYMAECYDVPFDLWDHLLLQELAYNCEGAFIVTFAVENRDGKLWGIAECQVVGKLTSQEMSTLKDFIEGQTSNGWGAVFDEVEIDIGRDLLYVHLYGSENWRIMTEEECFGPQPTEKMTNTRQMGGMMLE